MKHLILLFLMILPFSVHSQITFNDLKKIDSKEDFQRLFIEQGYERIKSDEYKHWETVYAFQPTYDKEGAYVWSHYKEWYGNKCNTFELYFNLLTDEHNRTYHRITTDIQENCIFYAVEETPDYDAIYYTCPGSLYGGKIGYYISDGWGCIETEDSKYID